MIDTTQPNEPETVTEAFRCGAIETLGEVHYMSAQAKIKQRYDRMVEVTDNKLQEYRLDYGM